MSCDNFLALLSRRPPSRPLLMGIVNATPDSFSDGGEALLPAAAAAKTAALVDAGADIIDLGGESTRPGAPPVTPDEEARRLLPALKAVLHAVALPPDSATRRPSVTFPRSSAGRRSAAVPISIDTRRAAVAAAAIRLGAEIVNDVSALADPDMASVVAESGAAVVLMHGYEEHAAGRAVGREPDGPPCTIEDVARFLAKRVEYAVSFGIDRDRIIIDPGLGFGKSGAESAAILRDLGALRSLGLPILVGPSRKRFLAALGEAAGKDRDEASRIAARIAAENGAAIVRLHAIWRV